MSDRDNVEAGWSVIRALGQPVVDVPLPAEVRVSFEPSPYIGGGGSPRQVSTVVRFNDQTVGEVSFHLLPGGAAEQAIMGALRGVIARATR